MVTGARGRPPLPQPIVAVDGANTQRHVRWSAEPERKREPVEAENQSAGMFLYVCFAGVLGTVVPTVQRQDRSTGALGVLARRGDRLPGRRSNYRLAAARRIVAMPVHCRRNPRLDWLVSANRTIMQLAPAATFERGHALRPPRSAVREQREQR